MGHEFDRTDAILSDIRTLIRDAKHITDRGTEVFFDPHDRTQRLAAKALIIDLQTAADGLPQSYRDQHPAVPWVDLRATRNYLAHDYASTDYLIVWNALVHDAPAIVRQLGLD